MFDHLTPANLSLAETIILLGAVVTALSILWYKLFKPIVNAAKQAIIVADTLTEIAKEFKPDHGTSLKDVITGLQKEQRSTNELVSLATSSTDARLRALEEMARKELKSHDETHQMVSEIKDSIEKDKT